MASTDDGAPPILDFSAFYGNDADARDRLIADIDRACRDKGFFQLTNTSVSQDLQDRILAAARAFFALPLDEKMTCDLRSNKYNRGYEPLGAQMLEPGTAPDKKEAIYFGEDLPADHPRVLAGDYNCGPNLYPPSLGPAFRATCTAYYRAALALATDVMTALALALGLDAHWFDPFVRTNPAATLRLIHYPPDPHPAHPNQRGVGAHRDFGCVTLLLQDGAVGGLQVQDERTGRWLDVRPVRGAFVVNVGNALMRWTNHTFTSATHRVLNASPHDRYSVPFFFSGNPQQVLGTIPGCESRPHDAAATSTTAGDTTEEAYAPVVLRDFLQQQFAASYARAQGQPLTNADGLRSMHTSQSALLQDDPVRYVHSEVGTTASTKQGEQATCGPDLAGPSPSQDRTMLMPYDAMAGELAYLRRRVAELESRARQMSTDDASSWPSPDDGTEANMGLLSAERPTAMRADTQAELDVPNQAPTVLDSSGSEDEDHDDDEGNRRPVSGKGGRRDTGDTVIKDAASILEFLAWGRRKDPEYHPSSSSSISRHRRRGSSSTAIASVTDVCDAPPPTTGGSGTTVATTMTTSTSTTTTMTMTAMAAATTAASDPDEDADGLPGSSVFDDGAQPLAVLQLLLPSRRQVHQLVDYHEACLLWYHASFFAPRFRADLAAFYGRHNGSIEGPDGPDLQWVALLFAVLAGSLTCAPAPQALAWGFRAPERHTLCRHWFQAVRACLHRGQYMARHSILSCQAVATLTISAHLLGFSNTQSIQLAAAVRIAQSLGLHRLGGEVDDDRHGSNNNNNNNKDAVDVEMGRRVWNQLCSQDWFSIPFSESYLVNPLHAQSAPPSNCHDADWAAAAAAAGAPSRPPPERPVHEPTVTGYCRFLHTIASLMPRLQDALLACNTAYTRYEQVRAWDARMRRIATAERPAFLANQVVPLAAHWPCWIPWARRTLAISSGHKIIMIHRACLSASFTNPAFALTRHTCLAASKTIIKEYRAVVREDGPVLWVHQAFSVAAAIILLLDVLHRGPGEREHAEHKRLAEAVVAILQQFPDSMIAVRGVKLLRALLDEVAERAAAAAATAASADTIVAAGSNAPGGVGHHRHSHSHRKRRRADPGGRVAASEHHAHRVHVTGTEKQAKGFNVPAFIRRFCQGNGVGPQRQQPAAASQRQQGGLTAEAPSHPVDAVDAAGAGAVAAGSASAVVTAVDTGLIDSPAFTREGVQGPDTDLLANYAANYEPQTTAEDAQDGIQLDGDFLLPPGWEGTNNGFENLLYLANHGFSVL
ncbi:Oxoglutarate/iron-dependent oxygenase [Niveomyces insectorum RCEF 264]|uniref:Oxoglutarate/iron-dependent oxygenase n=1 Tax=Niveomyces insectorum RCEF 264 TaxID=1081102 RepID=A0A167UVW4_9HYPO|nr:Oxoglutarate/iron-dependent oxygenase [Niveomyces insectorum RCEF 264]